MAMSTKRRHYRSRAISIITFAVHVSIKTALLENLVKKALARPLLSADAMGNEAGLRYSIDKIKNALSITPHCASLRDSLRHAPGQKEYAQASSVKAAGERSLSGAKQLCTYPLDQLINCPCGGGVYSSTLIRFMKDVKPQKVP